MNHRRLLLLGVLTLVSMLLGTFTSPAAARTIIAAVPTATASCAPPIGTGAISGTVLLPNGSGAQNVQVELYSTSGNMLKAIATNAAGAYSLSGLSGGNYLIHFNPTYIAGALLDEWYDNKADQASATPVAVNNGAMTTGVNATLAPGGRISGRVTANSTTTGLQSVNIRVYDATGAQVASAYTDSTGNYITSPGLRSGSYKLYFAASGGTPYLSEYYNGKPDLMSSDLIEVTAPSTVSGINAALLPGGHISGRITDATTGVGLANFSVAVSNADGYVTSSYTDANGNYSTTTGLASGTYQLDIGPVFRPSDYITQQGSATVVAPNTVTGVNFALQKGGQLTGRVTNSAGTPLPSITIFVGDETNDFQQYATTDAAGVYTVYGMPTNTYLVYFRPAGFLQEYYNHQPDRQFADRVAVTAPNTTSGIDTALTKGGAIKGQVTASDTGGGLANVAIEVYDASGDRIETANTDATGAYATDSTLPAGQYRVKFIPNDSGAACGYQSLYYNAKTTFATADQVTVTSPNVTDNVNIALQPGSSISGHVTGVGGAAVESVSVEVYDSTGERVADGRTNSAGAYATSPALASGSYRVEFRARSDSPARYLDEYFNDKPTLALADPITVTAPANVTGIDAALTQGGAIAGHVTAAATGAPLQYVSISVYDTAGEIVAYAYSDAAGAYTTSGLPSGSYRVRFEPRYIAGAYLGTFYGGAGSLAAAANVGVTAPQITPNINVALNTGATIAGTVSAAATATPLADVRVQVYDSAGVVVATTTTAADGTYRTQNGVAPGTYRLQFSPYGAASSYAGQFYSGKTSLANANGIIVAGATPVAGIDAALVKGSAISGTITDASTGAAIPRMSVEVYDADGVKVADGFSGATGAYITEPAVASGSYRVRFTPGDSEQLGGYIAEFYNDTATLASAAAVVVAAPATRTGIDAALSKGGQLGGRVLAVGATTRATGQVGQPGVTVTVYNSSGAAVATGETNLLGVYLTQPGLPNGSYRVSFTPPASSSYKPTFYHGKLTLAEANPITISAPGTQLGIDDMLRPVRSLFLPVLQH